MAGGQSGLLDSEYDSSIRELLSLLDSDSIVSLVKTATCGRIVATTKKGKTDKIKSNEIL